MINHKSRSSARYFFDLLFLYIIDLNFFIFPSLGIVGSQPGSFLEGAVRKLFSFGFHNDMGTRDSFCVEPPVISSRDLEGQILILVVVFADVDMESVGGKVVEWAACDFHFLSSRTVLFDEAIFRQLLLDLGQIFLL